MLECGSAPARVRVSPSLPPADRAVMVLALLPYLSFQKAGWVEVRCGPSDFKDSERFFISSASLPVLVSGSISKFIIYKNMTS